MPSGIGIFSTPTPQTAEPAMRTQGSARYLHPRENISFSHPHKVTAKETAVLGYSSPPFSNYPFPPAPSSSLGFSRSTHEHPKLTSTTQVTELVSEPPCRVTEAVLTAPGWPCVWTATPHPSLGEGKLWIKSSAWAKSDPALLHQNLRHRSVAFPVKLKVMTKQIILISPKHYPIFHAHLFFHVKTTLSQLSVLGFGRGRHQTPKVS